MKKEALKGKYETVFLLNIDQGYTKEFVPYILKTIPLQDEFVKEAKAILLNLDKGLTVSALAYSLRENFSMDISPKEVFQLLKIFESEGIVIRREDLDVDKLWEREYKEILEYLSSSKKRLPKIIEENPEKLEYVIQALKEENEDVRRSVVWVLKKIGGHRVAEPLTQALKDEDYDVRRDAADALKKIGKPAVEPLIKALEDENEDVRYWAIIALGEIGDERAYKPLICASQSAKGGVRKKIVEALKKIVKKMRVLQ